MTPTVCVTFLEHWATGSATQTHGRGRVGQVSLSVRSLSAASPFASAGWARTS